jgi:hypothetical protein
MITSPGTPRHGVPLPPCSHRLPSGALPTEAVGGCPVVGDVTQIGATHLDEGLVREICDSDGVDRG